MASPCAVCPRTSHARAICVTNQDTGEELHLCKAHFTAALALCGVKVRRDIVAAIRRQASAA
jgi:hypothetical protein